MLHDFIITTAILLILQRVQLGGFCPTDTCLTGGFFFAPGRQMVNNHALLGHVFDNWTVTEPVECFRKCRCDCRCISFNYLTNVIENNCELNDKNRHTSFSGLKPLQGSQYYDLVVNYDIRANVSHTECQNGCCRSQPCLNGGTCHETCGVTGKRFTCSCSPHFTGRFCETGCFKAFGKKTNWFEAQQTCETLNSNLVSIHSAEENNFLLDFVRIQVASRTSAAWSGLNKLTDKDFEWVDGFNVSFTKWLPGAPFNKEDGNCTLVFVDYPPSGYWKNVNCFDIKRPYICSCNCGSKDCSFV